MATDLLTSAMSAGGRCARYGDFVVVILQSLSFATTAQDYQMAQRWARVRQSRGKRSAAVLPQAQRLIRRSPWPA